MRWVVAGKDGGGGKVKGSGGGWWPAMDPSGLSLHVIVKENQIKQIKELKE